MVFLNLLKWDISSIDKQSFNLLCSDWWRWTCQLQMTTQCISPPPWWPWFAQPWRSSWHLVRLKLQKPESLAAALTALMWMALNSLVQMRCDMFVGSSSGLLAQRLCDADLKREINRVWPNLSQKTMDLLVTPHKCELQLCAGFDGIY